jgi:hypothetical protein
VHVVVGDLLEHMGGTEQTFFLERRRLKLQADRQAAGGEAARE